MQNSQSQEIRNLENGVKEAKTRLNETQLANNLVMESVDGLENRTKEGKADFLKNVQSINTRFFQLIRNELSKDVVELLKGRIAELERMLDNQTERCAELEAKNEVLRKNIVQIQITTEAQEENISNNLLKRIELLKNEKQELLLKLEAEEEMITNTLSKRLLKLQQEKVQMEVTLEQEQESIVNRLQKQLDDMKASPISRSLSRSSILGSTAKWSSISNIDTPFSNSALETLRAEADSLKRKISEMKAEAENWFKEVSLVFSSLQNGETSLSLPPIPEILYDVSTSPSPSIVITPSAYKRRVPPGLVRNPSRQGFNC